MRRSQSSGNRHFPSMLVFLLLKKKTVSIQLLQHWSHKHPISFFSGVGSTGGAWCFRHMAPHRVEPVCGHCDTASPPRKSEERCLVLPPSTPWHEAGLPPSFPVWRQSTLIWKEPQPWDREDAGATRLQTMAREQWGILHLQLDDEAFYHIKNNGQCF